MSLSSRRLALAVSMAVFLSAMGITFAPVADDAEAYASGTQDGSPDAYGYTYTDNKEPAPKVGFSWIPRDPSASDVWGLGLPQNDMLYGPFTLTTFQFTFYGVPFDSFWVSDNGFITFNSTSSPVAPLWPDHPRSTSPNNYISCFGDDLNPDPLAGGGGSIYWWETPLPLSAIITWENVTRVADNAPQTVQLILDGVAGTATCQYLNVTFKGPAYPPLTAIENDPGEVGLQYHDFLEDGLAVTFAPPLGAPPDTLDVLVIDRAPAEGEHDDYDSVMLQLDLNALSGSVGVDSVTVGLAGTAVSADIQAINLWWDRDRDGLPGHWVDKRLASASPSAGLPAVLEPAAAGNDPVLVTSGQTVTLLITFDVSPNPSGLVDAAAVLMDIALVSTTPDIYVATPPLPFPSSLMVIVPMARDDLNVQPTDLVAPGFAMMQGEGSVPLMAMALVVGTLHDVEITTIAVVLNGTATAAEIPTARLYRDVDANGLLDPAVDSMVAVAAFAPGPPYVADFNFSLDTPPYLGVYPGRVVQLIVAVDVDYGATPGTTVGLDLYSARISVRDSSDVVVLPPPDPFQTALAVIDPFVRPLRVSPVAAQTPLIDGQMPAGEWDLDSISIDVALASGNQVPGIVWVKNDAARLYVGVDAIGDETRRAFDLAGIMFDRPHDFAFTDGADHQFTIGGFPTQSKVTAHAVYNATLADWIIQDSPFDGSLVNHSGLEGAAGFGSPSPLGTPHRIYEFAIPLALLGAAAGDTVGIAFYSTFPDLLDGDPDTLMMMDERTWAYSAWPLHYRGAQPMPTPYMWGELCIGPCAANTPPRLANGTIKTEIVSMDLTGQSEPVDYSVEYSDADNDPPRSPYVWVNYSNGTAVTGSPFNMTRRSWIGSQGDYTAGAVYNITMSLPACDLYTYAFNASDGQANVFTPTRSGPLVNCQPTLTNGTVNPSAGDPGVTGFNYTVEYRDPDGNQTLNGTEFVYVNKSGVPIIGSPFPLSFGGWLGAPTDYTDGVLWYFNTTLALCGNDYTFAFNMSDDLGYGAWFPDAQGPVVNCLNAPPELLGPGVIPAIGGEAASFTYNVTYRDADNDAYVDPGVWINESGAPIAGSPFPLSLENWVGTALDYVAGANLSFTTALPLCGGNYTFAFNASDGQSRAFTTTSPGPQVNCAPSLNWTGETGWMADGVEPDTAPLGSSFQWRVDYFDADNEAPAATYPRVALFYGPTEWFNVTMWEVNVADTDYTNGKRYAFVTNLVNAGTNYTYCFLANDSFGQSAAPLCAAGPNVTATNLPPEVINGQVTPPSQTGATFDFEYNVTYRDPEGQPPAYVWTWVNESGTPIPGSPFVMGFVSFLGAPGNYTAGAVFNATVTLACGGVYGFSFQGNDGWNDAFTATSPGPTLGCPPNNPPVLSAPQVSPLTGDTNTVFNYSVVYSDSDGDPPFGTPWITVNESGAPVISQPTVWGYWLGAANDFVAGAVYNFSTTLGTPSIAYTFVFNATDGVDMVYSTEADAPDVVSAPDALTVTRTDVAPAVVNQGEVGVVMMVLNLTAAPGDVNVWGMNITLMGTASDTDVANVALYDDLDFSGTLSGGDSLIGQSGVVGGVAAISGIVLTVPGGGSKDVLVVYDVASGATPDVTVGARLASADVVVQPPDSVNAFAPLDSGVAVVNAPPSAMGLTVQGYSAGPDLAHITDHAPVLGWTYSDPNVGDAQSEFNVSVRESVSGVVLWFLNTTGGQNSATYPGAAPPLMDGGDYILRVSVRDSLGGLWNAPFTDLGFHMNALPPPPMEPAAPHNVTIPAAAGQTVSWAPGGPEPDGDTPVTYYWQVAENDPGFGTILAEGTAISTASAPFATTPGAAYYWRVNVTDGWEFTVFGPAWRGYWNFSTSGLVNAAPSLTWTGEANYVGDGLDPETGFLDTTFTYRVRYADADNDAPMGGAPNAVILKGGTETLNATMTFDSWVGAADDYVAGANYTYGTTLAAVGTDYTYRFYAEDANGAVAGGEATVETAGPVVNNRPPALDWTGETNYVADGADPDTGDLSTAFAFRISYSDPDDHAPGEVRLVVAQGGSEVQNVSMGEFDPLDTTYTDGKIYNVTLPAGTLSIGSYEYRFYAADVIGDVAGGAGTTPTTLDVRNRPPTLDWTQEPNYVSDGLHPESGDPTTAFVFRISYADPDNHSPGEVRLVITQGGSEVLNASMAEVDPSDLDHTDGKLYSFSTSLGAGTDYEYHFYAEDALGASASTAPVDAPDVVAPPGTITIVVWDEDQNGVEGATVTLTLSGQTFTPTPGEAGNYTFQDLAPGAYTLEVRKSGFQTHTSPVPIQVASGDNDPVTVTLQKEAPPPVGFADYWWVLLILAALVILALLLLGRRRRPVEEEGEAGEEDLESELAEELEEPEEAEEELDEESDDKGGGGEEAKKGHDTTMAAIQNIR